MVIVNNEVIFLAFTIHHLPFTIHHSLVVR